MKFNLLLGAGLLVLLTSCGGGDKTTTNNKTEDSSKNNTETKTDSPTGDAEKKVANAEEPTEFKEEKSGNSKVIQNNLFKITVAPKQGIGETIEVLNKATQEKHTVASTSGNVASFFVKAVKNCIVIDFGTGSSGRTFEVYNMKTKEKVFGEHYELVFDIKGDMLTVRCEIKIPEGSPKPNCGKEDKDRPWAFYLEDQTFNFGTLKLEKSGKIYCGRMSNVHSGYEIVPAK